MTQNQHKMPKEKLLSEKEVNLKTDDTCDSHVYNRTDVKEAVERLKEVWRDTNVCFDITEINKIFGDFK